MSNYAEINDTVTMSKGFLATLLNQAATIAAKQAAETTAKLMTDARDKETFLSPVQVSKILDCTPSTVRVYIEEGHPKKGKLKASKKGAKGAHYQVSKFDLKQFINQ